MAVAGECTIATLAELTEEEIGKILDEAGGETERTGATFKRVWTDVARQYIQIRNGYQGKVKVILKCKPLLEIIKMNRDSGFKATVSSSPSADAAFHLEQHLDYGRAKEQIRHKKALDENDEVQFYVGRAEVVHVTAVLDEVPLQFLLEDWPVPSGHKFTLTGPAYSVSPGLGKALQSTSDQGL